MTFPLYLPARNRLIVLDCYFDVPQQIVWLKDILEDGRRKGMHIITASHEITNPIVEKQNVTFQTLDNFEYKG